MANIPDDPNPRKWSSWLHINEIAMGIKHIGSFFSAPSIISVPSVFKGLITPEPPANPDPPKDDDR